jgi:DNA-binding MurR/RpiR family transcriptional regulator
MARGNALSLISSALPAMPKIEKKIANYILEFPTKAVNMTISEMAKSIGVSDGSIVRFANRLDFDGFTQLKINIAQHLPSDNGVLFDGAQKKSPIKTIMDGLKQNFDYSVENTIAGIDEETLIEAAKIIMTGKKIDLYGVGSSMMIAHDAYYRMLRIGLPVSAVSDPYISSVSAYLLDEKSVAIGFSYTGKSNDTINAMKIAKSRGAKTIALTSFSGSSLAKICDLVILIAAREVDTLSEATAARLTQLLVIDSLCLYISKRKKNTLEIMENIIDILGKHRE